MTRNQRKAIISAVMVVTMALSGIVTLPIAQRYSQAKIQQVAAAHKSGPIASTLFTSAIYPSLFALIGSMLLGIGAGLVAGRLLPPTEPTARRGRRR